MNSQRIIFCAIALACCIAQADEGPKDLIMKKDSELKAGITLYQKSPTPVNRERITVLINGIFDFPTMGRKALPKPVWDGADSAQRGAFVFQFKRMIEASSVKKLEVYQADSTLYDLAQAGDHEATVSAQVWYKGRQTKLQYKMTKENSTWTVWDLVIGDLSTVRNYREQFKTILSGKTLSDLTEILKKKADSYAVQAKNN